MSTRQPRSPKEHRRARDEEVAVREISPAERRKKMIINAGVGVLLIAFITTSGITCVNLNQLSPPPQESQRNNSPEDRLSEQLVEWQGKVQQSPNDPNALSNLGFFQLERATQVYANDEANRQKDLDAAMTNFETALKADPNYGFALQQKGRVYLVQKKFPEAKTTYEAMLTSAVRPVPEDDKNKEATTRARKTEQVQAHLGLAAVSISQKDMPGALGHLNQAIELDPGSADTYLQRATLHFQMKQNELARKDLETISEIGKHTGNPQMQQLAQQYIYAIDNNLLPDPDATPQAETPTPAAPTTPAAPATPAAPPTP